MRGRMEPVLFTLTSQKREWLATRESLIAGNIANANAPGHISKDIIPFSDVLSRTGLSLASTSPAHLGIESPGISYGSKNSAASFEVTGSGNNVDLE